MTHVGTRYGSEDMYEDMGLRPGSKFSVERDGVVYTDTVRSVRYHGGCPAIYRKLNRWQWTLRKLTPRRWRKSLLVRPAEFPTVTVNGNAAPDSIGKTVSQIEQIQKGLGRLLGALAVVALALTLRVPLAHASPDPHIPDPMHGYCPGGGAGNAFEGYCDGEHYPDGSYWHKLAFGVGTAVPWMMPGQSQPVQPWLSCVIDPDGGPIPRPAPPGGCGGAA